MVSGLIGSAVVGISAGNASMGAAGGVAGGDWNAGGGKFGAAGPAEMGLVWAGVSAGVPSGRF